MRTALVIGGARCVHDDVERILSLGKFHGVVTVNAITARWPGRIDAAVSKHPEHWPNWLAARDRRGLPRPDRILAHLEAPTGNSKLPDCITGLTEFRFPDQPDSGSSGLFGLKVALMDLGFDRAVMCGVPLTEAAGHVFTGPTWPGAHHYHAAWRQAFPHIRFRARSMSGFTADLLGQPDAEWLA